MVTKIGEIDLMSDPHNGRLVTDAETCWVVVPLVVWSQGGLRWQPVN